MDILQQFSLQGKVALVTGGAYGIGYAIAKALASDASNFVNGQVLYVDGGLLAYLGR